MATGSARPVSAIDDLYEADFYAWTQHQAALLREADLSRVDLVDILEEIETLGRKEVSELRSRLQILSAHLLMQIYRPSMATRSWATTILDQRIAIADHIDDNPSLKPKLAEAFAKAYGDGRKLAASETGLPSNTLPVEPPFGSDAALSQSWDPSAVASGPDGSVEHPD